MSVEKRFSISLDVKQPTSNREIEVVEGDTGNILVVTLTDNGRPVNLTDCKVCAVFAKPNGKTAMQDTDGNGLTVAGEGNNEITIELYNTSFSPGMVTCEIQVYSGEDMGTLVTSAQFNFQCRRGIANADTIQSTDEWPLLVGMIVRVEQAEDHLEDLNMQTIAATEQADSAATRANEAAAAAEAVTDAAQLAADNATEATSAASDAAAAANTAAGNAATAAGAAADAADRANAAAERAEPFVELLEGKADKTRSPAITLLADGWVGTEAPYTQTVAVEGLTGERFENPDVFAEFTDAIEDERAAWNLIDQVVSVEGGLEFTCLTEIPEIDIPLIVKVRD